MAAEGFGAMDPEEMAQAISSMKDRVVEAAQQASERLELDRRMRENPWVVLGVAAGAGFLLGGGLWPLLRPIVKSAARTALAPANILAVAAAVGAMKAAQQSQEEGGETGPATPTAH
jgi:hypothetical protein